LTESPRSSLTIIISEANVITVIKEHAKQTVIELICWPMSRPDLFTGLRKAQLSSWIHTSKRGTREVTKRSDVNNLDFIPLSNWNGTRGKKCLDHVRNLIGTNTEELIRQITSFPMEAPFNAPESHSLVEYMTTDYILDKSRHLWLSFIPSLCISSSEQKHHTAIWYLKLK
jgi:hypothetical protein